MVYCLRRAVVDDAPGIAAVSVASWKSAYRGLLRDQLLDNLSVSQRQQRLSAVLSAPAARSDMYVAVLGGAVPGFAGIGPRRCVTPAECEGELYSIYVHPEHWGRGAGELLHREALAGLHALGFTSATLWVLNGNERAINFYRRTGWQCDGTARIDTRSDGTRLPETQFHRIVSPP